MKKTIFYLASAVLLTACNQNSETENLSEDNATTTVSARRSCPSEEIRSELLKNDAGARERFANIETAVNKFQGKVLADGSVDIPVVVNVLYKSAAENISDARIAEQIAVLNADFAGTNADASKIPTEFSAISAGDTKVRFHLVKTVRKATTKTKWGTNDAMKKASSGGIDATTPSNYFNLWVVGNMGGILGYATFPESAGLWNDGVVIAAPYFGKTGAVSPYNLGRTATHEVGHYLNLRHIWGDAACGNDLVADTPTQPSENYGKPTYPLYKSCSGTSRSVMFMNYMDYVDDGAMFMFSAGQKARSQAVLTSTGARSGLRVY